MEMGKVLWLAMLKAIDMWEVEERRYKEFPNEFSKARREKAWNDVEDLEKMIKEEQSK